MHLETDALVFVKRARQESGSMNLLKGLFKRENLCCSVGEADGVLSAPISRAASTWANGRGISADNSFNIGWRHIANFELLCDRFIVGAEQAGHRAEKVRLRECHIGYCVACGACLQDGGKCWQEDDITWIMENMYQADAIVLATPVYKSCMCARLKTLVDRMFAGNQTLVNKDFYFITADADSKAAILNVFPRIAGEAFVE